MLKAPNPNKKGFDYWRSYFWTTLVPGDVMRQFRANLPPNNLGRFLRKVLYPPSMRPHYDWFSFPLDEEHIFFIKETYYTEDFQVKCTWEHLAQAFKRYFPESCLDGDKYDGIALTLLLDDYLHRPHKIT